MQTLFDKYSTNSNSEIVNTVQIEEKPKKKKLTSKPKESASLYEKGYTCVTEDSGTYKVIEYKRGDKIQKRWCKCKS